MANLNDVYEVRIICTLGIQTSINVRHYVCTVLNGLGPTDAQIASAMDTTFNVDFKSLLSVQATYRGVGVRRIKPLPVLVETSTIANLGVGTVLGDALPSQTCGVIKLGTAVAGKSYRGRIYVPFPSETDSGAQGDPNAGYLTNLGLLANTCLLQVTAGTAPNNAVFDPVIHSKKLGLDTFLSSSFARLSWGTQRKRGGFGRPNPPPF